MSRKIRGTVFIILLLCTVTGHGFSCREVFSQTVFLDAELQNLFEESHLIAAKLAQGHHVDAHQKSLYTRQLEYVYAKMVPLLSDSSWEVSPLYVDPRYFGEHHPPARVSVRGSQMSVPYLTEFQRSLFVWEKTEEGLKNATTGQRLKTTTDSIFVVGLDGRIYFKHTQGDFLNFKHSSFFASAPVLFAGTMMVSPEGEVIHLTGNSGHYLPRRRSYEWVVQYLQEQQWILTPGCCIYKDYR